MALPPGLRKRGRVFYVEIPTSWRMDRGKTDQDMDGLAQ